MATAWTNPFRPPVPEPRLEDHCEAPGLRLTESAFKDQLDDFEQCTRRQAARGLRSCARPRLPLDESDQSMDDLRRELAEFARCVHDRARDEAALNERMRLDRRAIRISGVITLAAAVIFVAHMLWTGLPMDNAALALIVIALVPWLGGIVKSFEFAGTKFEFRDIEQKLEQTRTEMEITWAETKDAVERLRGAGQSADKQLEAAIAEVAQAALPVAPTPRFGTTPRDAMDRLTGQYDSVREQQKPGDTRTAAMTQLWVQMRELAPSLPDFDVRRALLQEKGGKRLEGYAYLYERPDPTMLPDLIKSVGEIGPDGKFEAKPFEQYWGLLTIRRLQDSPEFGTTVTGARDHLETLLRRLKPGTDRHFVLSQILTAMDRSPGDNRA